MGYIQTSRFIDQLKECFDRNDKAGAQKCLKFWENEARSLKDDNGLLTVLNEELGFFRRSGEKEPAMKVLAESLELVGKLGLSEKLSGAMVYINAATTLSAFGRPENAPGLYNRAESCFVAADKTVTYEYAALLNNRAAAYYALRRYDEAERDWLAAIEILKSVGHHDGEIAVSLVMLAHVADERYTKEVESLLNEAWEYINSDDQTKDGRYADVLLKCAPSYDYFDWDSEAQALRETADEIYSGER